MLIGIEGGSRREITMSVQQAIHILLWSKQITHKTKLRIYQTIIQSIFVYCTEQKPGRQPKETGKNWSCGVSRLEKVTNEEIRKRMMIEKRLTKEMHGKEKEAFKMSWAC